MVKVGRFAVKFLKLLHYEIKLLRLTQYGSYVIIEPIKELI